MLDYIPLVLAGLALLFAAMPIVGLERWRIAMVVFSLGSGMIYLAVLALLLLLAVDNNWRLRLPQARSSLLCMAGLLVAILLLTISQPTDFRTYSELSQLLLYVLLFFLLTARLRDGGAIALMLEGCVLACLAVAGLALLLALLGWVATPAIFIDRGPNEASVFVALLGVVPCAVLFTRTRNWRYLLASVPMLVAQDMATSRGSLAVSVLVLLVAGFLWTRSLILRGIMVLAGLGVLASNVPQLMLLFDAQLNSSARERLALIAYAGDLTEERFWTGWGWGSTSRLASAAPNTMQTYPHFHNAYVQMTVELGLFGWIVLTLAAGLAVHWTMLACLRVRQAGVTALIVCSVLGIGTACLFDAMLFGADRSIQIVFLMALCSRSLALAQQRTAAMPARRPLSAALAKPVGAV